MSRILIIDDSNVYRLLLKSELENAGYEVHDAPDAKTGLEITRKYFINLVITDMFMPEIDGIQTIVLFKQEFPQLKIAGITEVCSDGKNKYLANLAKDHGAIEVFNKAYDIKHIISLISRIV